MKECVQQLEFDNHFWFQHDNDPKALSKQYEVLVALEN